MDSDEEGEEAMFDSLDDLVVFCMAHEMRVEGAEVQLREAVPCAEEAGAQVKAVSFGKLLMQDFFCMLYLHSVSMTFRNPPSPSSPFSCSSSKGEPWGGQ